MIRHVVLFKFRPDFDPALKAAWEDGVRGLVGRVPGLLGLELAWDELGSPRSHDASLIADFESLEAVKEYAVHPLHLPLIGISGPNAESIASVDYTVAAPA